MWYYRKADGEAGPFLARQMRKLASQGVITSQWRVRKGTEGKWIRATNVLGLLDPVQAESRQRVLPMPRRDTIDDVAASNAPLPCSFADTTPRTDLIVKPSTSSNPAFAEPPGALSGRPPSTATSGHPAVPWWKIRNTRLLVALGFIGLWFARSLR